MTLVQFVVVAGYLSGALCLLVLSRRLRPRTPLWRMVWQSCKARLLRKGKGQLQAICHDEGYCYLADIHPGLVSDADGNSWLVLYEDGQPLPRPHACHDEVRNRGHGAYSHWSGKLYFSTPDNSDPRNNGRTYTFAEVPSGPVGC
jgi:hypothetical protein